MIYGHTPLRVSCTDSPGSGDDRRPFEPSCCSRRRPAAAQVSAADGGPARPRARRRGPCGGAGDGRVPVEELAEPPFLTEPVLSPDGSRIAGRVSKDGNESIAIWTLGGGARTEPILIASSANSIVDGLGRQRAADHQHQHVRPDGLRVAGADHALQFVAATTSVPEVTRSAPAAALRRRRHLHRSRRRYVLLSAQADIGDYARTSSGRSRERRRRSRSSAGSRRVELVRRRPGHRPRRGRLWRAAGGSIIARAPVARCGGSKSGHEPQDGA